MERDGRSLDHKTLEELRMQAMERISDGETPSEVMAAYGLRISLIVTERFGRS